MLVPSKTKLVTEFPPIRTDHLQRYYTWRQAWTATLTFVLVILKLTGFSISNCILWANRKGSVKRAGSQLPAHSECPLREMTKTKKENSKSLSMSCLWLFFSEEEIKECVDCTYRWIYNAVVKEFVAVKCKHRQKDLLLYCIRWPWT